MNKDEIEELYNKVLAVIEGGTNEFIDPDDLSTAFNYALSKESLDVADKIEALMLKMFPDNTLTILVHAKREAMRGQPTKAWQLYESVNVNEIDQDYWEELPFASHCAIVSGKRQEALQYYKMYIKHLRRPGEELELHFAALAIDFYTFGRDRKRLSELVEATVERFRSVPILMIAANNMAMAERLPKSIEYLREASEQEPMNPEIWMMLTRACLQAMDYAGMREACRFYMALRPETRDFEMLMIQADGDMEDGNFELAMESLRKCSHIRGLSQDQRIMLTLATAQGMKNMKEPSKKIIEYLKRRMRVVGTDSKIIDMINSLNETED